MKYPIEITSIMIDDQQTYTLYELSQSNRVHAELIVEMVEYGLLEPRGQAPEGWQFTAKDFKRSQKALRLQHDLAINMPGIALALDLLEEMDQLRQQLQLLRKLTRE